MIKLTKNKIIPYSIEGTIIFLGLKALYDYAISPKAGKDVIDLYVSTKISAIYFPETWLFVGKIFLSILIIIILIYWAQNPPHWFNGLFERIDQFYHK
jgi:hypothetical protein